MPLLTRLRKHPFVYLGLLVAILLVARVHILIVASNAEPQLLKPILLEIGILAFSIIVVERTWLKFLVGVVLILAYSTWSISQTGHGDYAGMAQLVHGLFLVGCTVVLIIIEAGKESLVSWVLLSIVIGGLAFFRLRETSWLSQEQAGIDAEFQATNYTWLPVEQRLELCKKMSRLSSYCIDNVTRTEATKKSILSDCHKGNGEPMYDEINDDCVFEELQRVNVEGCALLTQNNKRDECYQWFSSERKFPLLCEQITDVGKRENCTRNASVHQ